jgi:protein kinase-like protein
MIRRMICAAGGEHVAVEVALAFADGTLATGERAEIERRIDACEVCRAVIAEAARSEGATVAEPGRGPRAAELAPGDRVGRYVVERALGAGGMGVVSLARDPELRRAVVIKLVRPDAGGRTLEARLAREAQAMAQLSHPNVVQIFDIGKHGDRVFLAMEFVPGQTLDAWLIERPRSADEILAMFRQAGAGLDAAHRAGLVHRDFKPQNVLVDRDGVAKVTDFGLARAQVASEPGTPAPRPSGVHAVLTRADAVIGTPAYMAPEQLAGETVDARTDQYAFALALLDALVGQRPGARSVAPHEAEAALAEAEVAPAARAGIARALRVDPAERFPSLRELLVALLPPRPRRRWWPIAAGVVLCGGAVAVWLGSRGTEACTARTPARWQAERPRIVETLAREPRPFARWRAEHVAALVDADVAAIADAELRACKTGAPEPCAAHAAQLDLLLAGNVWDQLDVLACAPVDARASALRARLPAGAAEVVNAARAAHLDRVLIDALELIARHELATHDIDGAARDLRELAEAGERLGDDAARGSALLQLLEIARWRGDHGAATIDGNALRAILVRHGSSPRDELTVALGEADAFTDLGDVARAFADWDRAVTLAVQLADGDALVRARTGRARARQLLRFDPDAVRDAGDLSRASAEVRAEALRTLGDIALAAGDAARAHAWLVQLPAGDAIPDRVQRARVRGLAGDVDGALADLAVTPADPADIVRVAVGRGQVLLAASRAKDAVDAMKEAVHRLRAPFGDRKDPTQPPMPMLERVRATLALCEAEIAAAAPSTDCMDADPLVAGAHPQSPLRARVLLAHVVDNRTHGYTALISGNVTEALAIATAADAWPGLRAELHWELARNDYVMQREQRAHGEAARDLYRLAGNPTKASEVEDWLTATSAGSRPSP